MVPQSQQRKDMPKCGIKITNIGILNGQKEAFKMPKKEAFKMPKLAFKF